MIKEVPAEINVVPVRLFNIAVLESIISGLKKYFTTVNTAELNLDIEPSYSQSRSQYYSTQIIAQVIKLTENIPGKILLLTDVDLYIPVLTYIFGEAQLSGKHSIVSLCRLHEEFYSKETNEKLLTERAMKEALHELGHNFGLKHCHDWDCVMHSSPGIEEIDIKGDDYCSKCKLL